MNKMPVGLVWILVGAVLLSPLLRFIGRGVHILNLGVHFLGLILIVWGIIFLAEAFGWISFKKNNKWW